jgi:hypothetical protein
LPLDIPKYKTSKSVLLTSKQYWNPSVEDGSWNRFLDVRRLQRLFEISLSKDKKRNCSKTNTGMHSVYEEEERVTIRQAEVGVDQKIYMEIDV